MGEPPRERVIVTAARRHSRFRCPSLPALFAAVAVVWTAAVLVGPSHAIFATEHYEKPAPEKQGSPAGDQKAGDQKAGDQKAGDQKTGAPKNVKPPGSSGEKPPSLPAAGLPPEAALPQEKAPEKPPINPVRIVSRNRLRALEFEEALRRGETAAKNRRWSVAGFYFREVLRRRPAHFRANLLLGRMLSKKAPRAAFRHLETARRTNPASGGVHFSLGAVLESLGRNSAAADSYRKAIFFNPRYYEANNRLHRLLRRMRRRKTVVQRAAESFEANPSLATLTLFGRIVMERSTARQALSEFDLLSRRHPQLPEIHLWRARARRKAGDSKGELEAYRIFLSKRPEAHAVRLLLIERFQDQGLFKQAETLVIPFGVNAARQDRDISPEVRGRYLFLHSRLLARRKLPASAARGLLLAHRFIEKREPIDGVFAALLASFPGSEGLWEAYGDWMRRMGRPAEAAEAWLRAARLDPGRVPRAVEMLAKMTGPGSGETMALAVKISVKSSVELALAELYSAQGDYKKALVFLKRIPPAYPITPQHALMRGRIHFKTGKFETALEDFLQYLMAYTSHLDILHARGNLFWEMGRQQKALKAWLQNPSVLTRHPIGLLKVAGIYQLRGDASKETAARERLAQLLPSHVLNRIRLGNLYLAQGRQLDALGQLKDLASERPGDQSLLLKIGRIWVSLGKSEQAVPYLEKAARLGKLDPDSTALYGAYLYRKGRFGEALEQFRYLYSLQPNHPALPTALPELVTKLPAAEPLRIAAARMAIRAGRRETAVILLKLVVGKNPKNLPARMLLANLHLKRKQADQALSVLMAAGPVTRKSTPFLKLLARAQQAAGQFEPLAVTLELLQSRRPKDFRLARRRASLLSRLGRYPEARSILETIWKADRSAFDVIFSLVRVERKMKILDTEEKRMAELLAYHPNYQPAQRRLIRLWVRAEKWNALLPLLTLWVRNNPGDAIARYNLVVTHLRRNDNTGARPHFEALKNINPGYSKRLESYFR